ncbi:hypothetical protein ACXIUH_08830 [Vibrio parahaemolyticus]
MKKSVFLGAVALLLGGCDQVFGPKDYDDCILQNMKGVNSDLGAKQIAHSCRVKFVDKPKVIHKERSLTLSELWEIGRTGFGVYNNAYLGSLYNGNADITITSLLIEITESKSGSDISRKYLVKHKIKPLTTEDFSVDIITRGEGAKYWWKIVSAKGYVDPNDKITIPETTDTSRSIIPEGFQFKPLK